MALELYRPGAILRNGTGREYRVVRAIEGGANAAHQVECGGERFLLKTYVNIGTDRRFCAWFDAFKNHQEQIRQRISRIPDHAVQFVDHFVEQGKYQQVIEWADGAPLDRIVGARGDDLTVDDAILIARVFAFCLRKVHEQGLVHCDLKPGNVYTKKDPSLGMGFRLRVSDFDCALVDGRPCPIPGAAYLGGTAGYQSPEHLQGRRPVFASDVFTAGGVILFELLMGAHPFLPIITGDTEEEAQREIFQHLQRGWLPDFVAVNPARAALVPDHIREVVLRCLAFDPAARPTAVELHAELMAPATRALQLVLVGGPRKLRWRIRQPTVVSRDMCTRMFAADSATVSSHQATVEPNGDFTEWFIVPRPGTTNATMIDGEVITSRTPLVKGNRLQIGNAANGNVGFELEVDFEPKR